MLVLTRKKSESVSIGQDIVITITQIGSGKVKLGIEAPPHVRILRSELARFESPVPTDSDNHSLPSESSAEGDEQHDAAAIPSPVDYTTDYAIEIEDQMRCLLAY